MIPCWSWVQNMPLIWLVQMVFMWSKEWKIYCCGLLSSEPQKLKFHAVIWRTTSKNLHERACRTCSTILFPHSTNQINDLWRCRRCCRRRFVNSPFIQKSHGLHYIIAKTVLKTSVTLNRIILPSLFLSDQTDCMSGQTLSMHSLTIYDSLIEKVFAGLRWWFQEIWKEIRVLRKGVEPITFQFLVSELYHALS
mgnify:CR=1 FL=1